MKLIRWAKKDSWTTRAWSLWHHEGDGSTRCGIPLPTILAVQHATETSGSVCRKCERQSGTATKRFGGTQRGADIILPGKARRRGVSEEEVRAAVQRYLGEGGTIQRIELQPRPWMAGAPVTVNPVAAHHGGRRTGGQR